MRYFYESKQLSFTSRISLLALLGACLPLRPAAAEDPPPHPHQPVPVKLEDVFPLPSFCIAEGLQEAGPRLPVYPSGVPYTPCSPPAGASIWVPPGNADDVAAKLQPQATPATSGSAAVTAAAAATGIATATATGTGVIPPNQFTLTATDDKRSVIIFCRAKDCPAPELVKLKHAIVSLAKPKFSYFKNYSIDSLKTGKALAQAVPVINAKLKAEVTSPTNLRVESDQPLSLAEQSAFDQRFEKDRVQAIIAGQTPPDPDAEKKKTAAELAGNSPDVQVTAADLPYFCQSNSLTDSPTAPEKNKCPDGTRLLQANNVDAVIQALSTALGKTSKINLSKDANRILISCDTKCTGDALAIVQSTIAATARLKPAYVRDLDVPRGTSEIAAAALRSATVTATVINDLQVRLTSELPVPDSDLDARLEYVRELGFGSLETQPLRQMFYRSAAEVVADLLSTPAPATPVALGGNAATPPVTSAAESAAAAPSASTAAPATTTAAPGTTVSITNNPAPAPAAPAAPTPGPAPTGTVGQGMTSVEDVVVFTDTSSPSNVRQRTRLLAMLDLPRPEVLMNMWSLQASSPNGKEVARGLQKVRDMVNANNDALQHAIDYGWAYLSRQIKNPDAFFEPAFYHYLTQRFIADTADCEAAGDPKPPHCLSAAKRKLWDACQAGQYCLGYTEVFKPLRPSLTSIILAMMAAKDTAKTVLTTIGCMEGKFEVYGDVCFPDRKDLWPNLIHRNLKADGTGPETAGDEDRETVSCLTRERQVFLTKQGLATADEWKERNTASDDENVRQANQAISCELLDRAAVYAQRACGQTPTLPLSCFTLQAAASFLPENSFSTFSLIRLNDLAEKDLTSIALPPQQQNYSATNVGVLRSAVSDFLFNYKMATQFPGEFGTYSLPHSAQELNARFNPLVVAFNQDVGALSRALMDEIEDDPPSPNQDHFFQLWRHNKSFVANGLLTVRGISGVESLVDTDTQNSFDSTQAQTLTAVLGSIMGTGTAATPAASGVQNTINVNPDGSVTPAPSGPTPPSPLAQVAGLFKGATSAGAIATALAAITPTETHSIIGRQLTLDVIPHTLPGASSAELDVRLWAQEDSPPTIYSSAGTTQNDFVSRVARHNVATRVRVESVKLFDVSSFTAMVQRPRARLPIVPPFIEIPLIGSLLSVPLPAARIYHASTAIVSAIIVPTAADLAYGLVVRSDRAVFRENKNYSSLPNAYSLRRIAHQRQIPDTINIFPYHYEMLRCLAAGTSCDQWNFSNLPPER